MTLIEAISEIGKALENLANILTEMEQSNEIVPFEAARIPEEETVTKENEKNEKQDDRVQMVTIEQVRAVLAEKSQAGLTGKVKELLEKFGANKLSAVKPEDYAALLAAAKELK